jgi:hypothetical protein
MSQPSITIRETTITDVKTIDPAVPVFMDLTVSL